MLDNVKKIELPLHSRSEREYYKRGQETEAVRLKRLEKTFKIFKLKFGC